MGNSLSGSPHTIDGFDSQALRNHTSSAHRAVERSLDLPGAIKDFEDYRRWVARFFGIYYPIEDALGGFTQWEEWNIPFEPFGRVKTLSKDLTAMSVQIERVELASTSEIPQLSNFAEALGALYVIEGSSLGGRFILSDLSKRLGQAIDGRDAFFAGHGAETGQRWNAFKTSLDHYLSRDPVKFSSVVTGAIATFASVGAWMSILTGRGKP